MLSIDSLLSSRALAIYGLFSLATAILATAWALFKLSFQRGAGRPLPRNWFTITMDVLVDFAQNVAGAINRMMKFSGSAGIFLPTQPTDGAPVLARAELEGRLAETERSRDALMRAIEESTAAPPRNDGQRGSISLRALLALLVIAVALGAALSGCPNWQRPSCPTPGRWSCVEDWPRFCAPTRELTPIGDEPCALQGRVCALRADGVARCAPRADAGLDTDGGQ